MEQNKNRKLFILYAYVSQLLIMLLVLTIGGYLLGKYVIIKTTIAGGIFATFGAISGIIIFIMEMLKLGKDDKQDKPNN